MSKLHRAVILTVCATPAVVVAVAILSYVVRFVRYLMTAF